MYNLVLGMDLDKQVLSKHELLRRSYMFCEKNRRVGGINRFTPVLASSITCLQKAFARVNPLNQQINKANVSKEIQEKIRRLREEKELNPEKGELGLVGRIVAYHTGLQVLHKIQQELLESLPQTTDLTGQIKEYDPLLELGEPKVTAYVGLEVKVFQNLSELVEMSKTSNRERAYLIPEKLGIAKRNSFENEELQRSYQENIFSHFCKN